MPTFADEIGAVPYDQNADSDFAASIGAVPYDSKESSDFIKEIGAVPYEPAPESSPSPSLRAAIPAPGQMEVGAPAAPDALQMATPSSKTPEILAKDELDARNARKNAATLDYVSEKVSELRSRYDTAIELTDDPGKRQRIKDDYEKQLSRLGVVALKEAPGIAEATLTPLFNIPKVSKEDMQVLFPYSRVAQVAGAAQRVAAGATSGLTAPAVLATGVLPPGGQAVAAGAFGVQMASELPAQTKAAYEAIKSGDTTDTVEAVANLGLTSIFAAGALSHAQKTLAPTKGQIVGDALRDFSKTAEDSRINADQVAVDALDPVTRSAFRAEKAGAPLTAEVMRGINTDQRKMVADVPANGAGEITAATPESLGATILPGQPEATAAEPSAVPPEATAKGEIPNEVQKEKGQQEGLLNAAAERPEEVQSALQEHVSDTAESEGTRSAREIKSELVQRLESALDESKPQEDYTGKTATKATGETYWSTPPSDPGTITIDIPGDGTFTIVNTKESIGEVLKRARRISTASTEPVKVKKTSVPKVDLKEFQEQSPEMIGMGGALHEGEPAKAQVAQLGDAIQALAEAKPRPGKVREAALLGEAFSDAKDSISKGLSGLKAAGDFILKRLEGRPEFGDVEKAMGDRSLELYDSKINNKRTLELNQKAVPDPLDRAAISKWVDAGGKEDVLKHGEAETVDRFKEAYRRAQKLPDDLVTVAKNIQNYFESRLQQAIDQGFIEGGIEDYIHRYYPGRNAWKDGVLSELNSQVSTAKPSFAKERVFQYDFEAEKAGLKPEQDFAKRVAAYDLSLNKAIADKNFVKSINELAADKEGNPAIVVSGKAMPIGDEAKGATLIKPKAVDAEVRTGYIPIDHPAFRKWKWAGKDENGNPIFYQGDVYIRKDLAPKVKKMLERSAVAANPVGRLALNTSAMVKQTMLDLSMFHLTQISLHGLEHRSLVPLGPKSAKLTELAFNIKYRPLDELINVPEVRNLVRGGLMIGERTGREMFHEGLSGASLTKYIPFVGKKLYAFTDYLFNDYIPRLKIETGLHALERNRARYPELSEDELNHLTAKQMNAAFGELNYEMLGISPTARDAMRLTLLAPDFLIARGQFVEQAVTGLKSMVGAGKGYGREQAQALLYGLGAMYFGARILNKMLDDEWHFEPRNAFSVIYNKRAYGLRTVQGDLLHLFTEPFKFISHRLNPVFVRPLHEALWGRDEFGRSRGAWDQVKDFASTMVPISLKGVLNPTELDLFDSFLNSLGITERRASSSQGIYEMAMKYRDDHKMRREPGEFIYDPSKDPFRAIRNAALYHPDNVATEIQKAVKKGDVTKAQIAKHFKIGQENGERNFAENFVGKLSEERNFYNSLSDDQKAIYRDAVKERKEMRRVIERALR